MASITHIDRKSLYTDLEKRVEYLHAFLNFGQADIDAMALGAKYIKALIPTVVDIVYVKLLSFDITSNAFTTRSTSYTGVIDEVVKVDSPQILHRKFFLRGYLNKLCSDPSSPKYWQYLDKVGMMHVGLGRKHPLHIEYIHLSVLLGYVQDIVFEAVLTHPDIPLEAKTAVIKALGKILWIQNDLMAKWHVKDGAEFEEAEDDEANPGSVDQEGYLNGEKVYDEDYSAVQGSGCPFAGAATEKSNKL